MIHKQPFLMSLSIAADRPDRSLQFAIVPLLALLMAFLPLGHLRLQAADKSADTKTAPPDKRSAENEVDFAKQVFPLLKSRCFDCHGPESREAGLRLDIRQAALRGGDSGAVIKPGKSGESPLIARVISEDPDKRMPPEDDPLSAEEVATLRQWIDQGAHWPDELAGSTRPAGYDHWAYQPLDPGEIPTPQNAAWVRNPIDAYVLAKLEAAGIEPSPEADRNTLLRRLSLDLLGLPPTPEQVAEFLQDDQPGAYGRLVDRTLASPHFGERWGRHWLDLARYADSDGYEKDRPRPNAWRYRDWVIKAINDDMPFDQFTIEQMAGDLLPEPSPENHLATAFHRQTLTNTEGGTDQEEFRVAAIVDRVNTIGSAWLGLTVGCAQCHSHKYDPLTQVEYYELFAFFNNADEANTDVNISQLAVEKYKAAIDAYEQKKSDLDSQLEHRRHELRQTVSDWTAGLIERLDQPPQEETLRGKVVSRSKTELKPLDDGSYLSGKPGKGDDVYTLTFAVPAGTELAGIRLEVLPDESLPGHGPGWSSSGNFVLNELKATLLEKEDAKTGQELKLADAQADFSQSDWDVAGAIDGQPKTGWAVSPKFGQSHAASFRLVAPVKLESQRWLRLELVQEYGGQHTIGRFRIVAKRGLDCPVPLRAARQPLTYDSAETMPAEEQLAMLVAFYLPIDSRGKVLLEQQQVLEKSRPQPPTMTVSVLAERSASRRDTHLLRRGDFLQPAEESLQPGTPEVLPPLRTDDANAPASRLDLAKWLVGGENPLPPRVTVNHMWLHLFGEGLVGTVNDFGIKGEEPSHPKLLDWLAVELRRLGWCRKAMIKLIVMSSTYRQSSQHRSGMEDIDPQNRLLHRQNRFRVEAEVVRDVSLAASGLLSDKIGGPSVFPPMPEDVAALSYANNFRWTTSEGEDRYRRGMYTFFKRTAPHPNLVAFDCPDSNTTCVERSTSNTPLQALTTLNNETYVEASRALARLVVGRDELATDEDRIRFAFQRCVAREPEASEAAELHSFLVASRDYYAQHAEQARDLVAAGNKDTGTAPAELAAWTTVSRVIMNLDEFFTRE